MNHDEFCAGVTEVFWEELGADDDEDPADFMDPLIEVLGPLDPESFAHLSEQKLIELRDKFRDYLDSHHAELEDIRRAVDRCLAEWPPRR